MKRPLLYCVLAFASGIFLGNSKLGIAEIAILFILCEICCYLSKRINIKCVLKLSQNKIFLLLGCMLFGTLFFRYYNFIRLSEIQMYDKEELEIIGVIEGDGIKKGTYWQYVLKDVCIDGKFIKSKILLKSKSEAEYGNFVKVKAEMEIPKGASNYNTFDYCKYLKTLNIYITAKSDKIDVLTKNKLNFVENISNMVRKKVKEFTLNTLEKTEAGILNALIIGDESSLEHKIESDYKKAGMLHLLVVSGGHTVFLIILLKKIVSFLGVSKNLSKILYILTILIYIVITGATPSILRAGLGLIIVIIASFLGRQNDTFTTMGTVAFILFINNPNILFSLSFLLSFGGVLGIIICYPKVSKRLNKIPKIIAEPLSLTISAQLFVTPITIYSFNIIYWGGIISNIFTLNLSGIIMMIGIILFILYLLIPPVVFFPMKLLSILVFIMNKIAGFFGKIDWLCQYVTTPNTFSIILYYMLLFYIFSEKRIINKTDENSLVVINNKFISFFIKKRKAIIVFAGIVSLLILNIKIIDFDKSLKIDVIDVGHGDSILITTPNNKHILIDTGDKYYQGDKISDAGEQTIIPYLLKQGIKKIDLIVLTHMDSDHIGGFQSISKAINVNTLAISTNSKQKEKYNFIKNTALDKNIKIRTLKRGDKFKVDNVEFDVLMPQKGEEITNENNDSIVLLMKHQGKKVLFMGDLEEEGGGKITRFRKKFRYRYNKNRTSWI